MFELWDHDQWISYTDWHWPIFASLKLLIFLNQILVLTIKLLDWQSFAHFKSLQSENIIDQYWQIANSWSPFVANSLSNRNRKFKLLIMGFHLSIHIHNIHDTHTFRCPIMGRSEILVMQHLSKSNNEERDIHLHKIYLFSISPCFHPNLTIEKLYFFNPEMNFSFSSNLKGGLV